jgi:hypothetical protein
VKYHIALAMDLKAILYKLVLYDIIKLQKKIPLGESNYQLKALRSASSEGFAIIFC